MIMTGSRWLPFVWAIASVAAAQEPLERICVRASEKGASFILQDSGTPFFVKGFNYIRLARQTATAAAITPLSMLTPGTRRLTTPRTEPRPCSVHKVRRAPTQCVCSSSAEARSILESPGTMAPPRRFTIRTRNGPASHPVARRRSVPFVYSLSVPLTTNFCVTGPTVS